MPVYSSRATPYSWLHQFRWTVLLLVCALASGCTSGSLVPNEQQKITTDSGGLARVVAKPDRGAQPLPAKSPTPAAGRHSTPGGLAVDWQRFRPQAAIARGSPAACTRVVKGGDFDLRRAISSAVPGATICVRAGLYQPLYLIGKKGRKAPAGRADAWLTIRNYPGERPVILATDTKSGVTFWADEAASAPSYIEFRGFEIISAYAGGLTTASAFGISVADFAHHIRVVDTVVHNFPGNGIAVGIAANVLIENNVVYGNSKWYDWQGSGISLWKLHSTPSAAQEPMERRGNLGFNNIVRGNIVFANKNLVDGPASWGIPGVGITDGNCIVVERLKEAKPAYRGTTLVENNLCFDNGGRGVHVLRSDNVWVLSNTLYHNGQTRLCDNPWRNPNNTGCANDPMAELTVVESANIQIRNNLIVTTAPAQPTEILRAQPTLAGNLFLGLPPASAEVYQQQTARMVFRNPSTDPAVADFRLRPGSIATRAGIPSDAQPIFDLQGLQRSRTAFAAGAYD